MTEAGEVTEATGAEATGTEIAEATATEAAEATVFTNGETGERGRTGAGELMMAGLRGCRLPPTAARAHERAKHKPQAGRERLVFGPLVSPAWPAKRAASAAPPFVPVSQFLRL